jgi:hypothetical protein
MGTDSDMPPGAKCKEPLQKEDLADYLDVSYYRMLWLVFLSCINIESIIAGSNVYTHLCGRGTFH